MKPIDLIIVIIVISIMILVIRQLARQNKKGACSSCEHSQPKWINDYKRGL